MSASPVRHRKSSQDSYTPKIITTVGARPACLVNASVTYVGNDQIYAFGGFDQYTDEVYNHVLKLNLQTRQWSLVDNYGDIPGVRMGHTANLWQGDKLLVYGGENEHRAYLSDVIIFDLKTAHWTQPELHGTAPRGRARHSAVIHDEKLYIVGGMTGHESYVLDDICYLDLKTWTWSRTWRFVHRYDHTSWVWGGRIWVFGGMGEEMERTTEVWWLDLRGNPSFESPMGIGSVDRRLMSSRQAMFSFDRVAQPVSALTGYAANSSSLQTNPASLTGRTSPPVAPGAISSLKFISSPHLPTPRLGLHFYAYSSGCLLDFVTPASVISAFDTCITSLDLETLRWQRLAEGKDLFSPHYRWHYCAMNEDGTQAWLLGCPTEGGTNAGTSEEYLSDVLPIDLRKFGLLGNSLTAESRAGESKLPASDTVKSSHLNSIGADLARMFDQPPETGSGVDFVVTAEADDVDDSSSAMTVSAIGDSPPAVSKPIHVHKLILQARWPHFSRLYASQMLEFQQKKMHIPEPYGAVRAFLYYLYTDSIAPHPEHGPTLADVAGMLVMANIYDMPRLRLLCVNRLGKELDIEHAAVIWERAGVADEQWLRRRAAAFCMTHWGRIVRTSGFKALPQRSIVELCEEIDAEGRVVGGEELELVGGLGGTKFGMGLGGGRRKRKSNSVVPSLVGEETETDDGEEGMDVS
ncbi:kelch repeat protein [Trichodelitschia bisporula]|uniref:Kelch repeat protein n=1 Tax=Trichodelitschia bisporula TaxID=703511 RepID=A0A6G1I0E7_9PEZI|nr:kelch repeat protein [Trichodelitschia bisporula]